MDYVIQVTDLVKSFGKETVLHHINMNFAPGKIHGIIGRNGSGKTMLMKCICGFIPVTSGKVTVFGKVIGKDVDIPDNIGAIIETPGFLPEYGAYRNLKFLADITGRASKEKIRNAMQSVGLDPDSKKYVGKFSLGMRQRLGLAQAIMEDPDLLILDEPTLGLDVMSREAMIEELQEYLDSEGTGGAPRSVLISSHISSDLEKFCDDIYMIDRGKIVLHGETDVLLDSYGILKVDERQYQALDRRYLLAGMREAYGYRLLTNERRYYQENYPDLVMEKGSIDDILILTARGEKL